MTVKDTVKTIPRFVWWVCHGANATEFFSQPDIDGALVGGAA